MSALGRPMYYALNADGTTTPVAELTMADWDIAGRRIGRDLVGAYDVSTVFLVHDHQWGDGPPLLFETMVFAADDADLNDLFCARYYTKAAAEAGHRSVVEALTAGRDLGSIEVEP